MRVLIPGAAGALGRLLVQRLLEDGHDVIGVDRRSWAGAPCEFHEVDIRKRPAEELFRKVRPHAVVHMATVTSLLVPGEERHRINLGGTRAVIDHCRDYGVEHFIFVGRHTYYGAGSDSPLFHTEDEPPLAMMSYPELSDLVAADLYAAMTLWRSPDLVTTVLRVCYTLGASGHGTLATFLAGKRVPTVLGFDPLFQFLHELDVVEAIRLTLSKRPRGIFNVAGPDPLPLSAVIREAGRTSIPLPQFLFARALGRFGLPGLSKGALSHIKYPVIVDPKLFVDATGFRHAWSASDTLHAFRAAFPPPLE